VAVDAAEGGDQVTNPTPKPRTRKRLTATVYAIRQTSGKRLWFSRGGWGSFAGAHLWKERPEAGTETEVVPCRVTPLLSARKNRKRTR